MTSPPIASRAAESASAKAHREIGRTGSFMMSGPLAGEPKARSLRGQVDERRRGDERALARRRRDSVERVFFQSPQGVEHSSRRAEIAPAAGGCRDHAK